jgi:mannose-6-phosphate isomerase-like protein (cupin superfamily)
MWPGNGALYRTFQVMELQAGDRTIDFRHPSDSAYYVAAGSGSIVDLASGDRFSLVEGAMLHIDKGDGYRFEASDQAGVKLIGGPCPADPQLYAHLAAVAEAS